MRGIAERDSVTRYFASVFFLESVSPKPLIITLGLFWIFSKIRGDIRSSRFATGVNDTRGKWQKISSRKFLIILFGHLKVVELTFCLQVHFKLSAAWYCCHYLPPVSTTPAANLPPVSTTLAKMVEKFATGVADTGGKFATGVVDTGGNFAAGVVDTGGKFANFRKNSKRSKWNTLELGGNWFMKKNQKQKISWHCPFKSSSCNSPISFFCGVVEFCFKDDWWSGIVAWSSLLLLSVCRRSLYLMTPYIVFLRSCWILHQRLSMIWHRGWSSLLLLFVCVGPLTDDLPILILYCSRCVIIRGASFWPLKYDVISADSTKLKNGISKRVLLGVD